MPRKNKPILTKYAGIYKLEMLDNNINYIAIFSHQGTRYGETNLTKRFGVKTAKTAFEKLTEIKIELSKGNNVLYDSSDKVEFLLTQYLKTKKESYRRKSTATYNKNIKSVIGHLRINNVTKAHLEKIISNMTDNNSSPGTIKKVKTILNPIFKEAFQNEIVSRNILEAIKFGEDIPKPPLTDRINEPLLNAIRKIYQVAIEGQDNEHKAVWLISIMCSRRIGEIVELDYESIINGVVNVKAGTTKSYQHLHSNATAEKFPLPKEVLEIIGTGTGRIFKYKTRAYIESYKKLVNNKAKLELKPLATDYPILSHENRNFIMSIQAKEFGRDFVGSACLSHSDKSNINERYNSIEYSDIENIFKNYWKKLRTKPTSQTP